MPSSVIRRWRYDEPNGRLLIQFVSGKVYAYHSVPADIALEMRLSLSKGGYFNERIRDRFDFTQEKGWLPGPDSNRRPID